MKKFGFSVGIIILLFVPLLVSSGCSLFGRNPDLSFDVGSEVLLSLSSRASTGITDYPFCEFNKYEVTVYFVYAAFYNPDVGEGLTYSMHTMLNKPEGEGIVVDLAKEKLSEALASNLIVEEPAGNGLDKIYIGMGDTVVVNGYLYNCEGTGNVYRTTANGPVVDDGQDPVDWTVNVSGNASIPAYSVDETNPPLKADLQGVYLWLAGGGDLTGHGHTHITVEEADVFEFRFPLDLGVVKGSGDTGAEWHTCDVNAGTPFVDSSTLYYKYYIKRSGESYYTDMMRMLTDVNGKMILGQLLGMPFNIENVKNVFNSEFNVWYNADDQVDDSVYDTLFSINDDHTINFDNQDQANNNWVTTSNFDLLSNVGDTGTAAFNVNGTNIAVDYIRVE